jgi:hypothetical protein
MALFLAAFSLGFLSSLHCVGMCGPIALAVPVDRRSWLHSLFGITVYNAGRIASYTLLGAFLGLAGMGLLLEGYQQYLSLFLGILLLAGILYTLFFHRFGLSFGARSYQWIRKGFQRWLGRKDPAALWMIGLLNGLLPCGMVYLALAGATASGTIKEGALFMAAFGLGTFPAMLSVSLFIGISNRARNLMRRISPVLTAAVAVLLILRGLALGIPYISPAKPSAEAMAPSCHAMDAQQARDQALHCTPSTQPNKE